MKHLILLSLSVLTAITPNTEPTKEYDFEKAKNLRYYHDKVLIDNATLPVIVYDTDINDYIDRKTFIEKYGKAALKQVREINSSPTYKEELENGGYERLFYGAGKMPFNERGQVVFSEVVQVDGALANTLYAAAKMSIIELFNSANDVVQLDDASSNIIIVKGMTNAYAKGNFGLAASCPVWFTMKIQARDNRYKISIYQLYCKDQGYNTLGGHWTFEYSAEDCTDAASLKNDGTTKMAFEGMARRFIIEAANSIMASIKGKIAQCLNSESDTENDW